MFLRFIIIPLCFFISFQAFSIGCWNPFSAYFYNPSAIQKVQRAITYIMSTTGGAEKIEAWMEDNFSMTWDFRSFTTEKNTKFIIKIMKPEELERLEEFMTKNFKDFSWETHRIGKK